jgi:hypothetical protein
MFRSFIIATVSVACLLGSVAQANVVETSHTGVWSSIAGVGNNGKQICGAQARGSDRWFFIKWIQGETILRVQIMKTGWNIPAGTPVPTAIQFDGLPPWQGKATPFPVAGIGDALELLLSGGVSSNPRKFRRRPTGSVGNAATVQKHNRISDILRWVSSWSDRPQKRHGSTFPKTMLGEQRSAASKSCFEVGCDR